MHCFLFFRWIKMRGVRFRPFFFIWQTKKRSLVALEKSSLYTVAIALESDGTSSMLVVLGEWLSYGRCLNRFDCD